jgi:hypothetical protein
MSLRIEGAFSGFHDRAVFRLTNGQAWQQSRYKYRYKYAYRPEVEFRGSNRMYIPCMDDEIEVRRVSVLCEGPIVSDFNGFSGDSEFTFQNGQVWQQDRYLYAYHYAYRPSAIVVDGIDGKTLYVEGMSQSAHVSRIS